MLRSLLICLVLAAVCSSAGYAGALDTAKIRFLQQQTLRGHELTLNFDFAAANRAYDEAIAAEPLYPRPWMGKMTTTFWDALLARRDETYGKLLSQADQVVEKAERYIEKYGKNADVLTCLGTVYGYRAFAHARMKNYLKAAWDGKRSYDSFEEAVKMDERWYDAYSGLGLYHYFVSFIPKTLQWVVGILGIQGNSERGIRELGVAMDKGMFNRAESKYYLAEMLPWHSDNFDSSEVLLRQLQTTYPDNALLSFTIAVWELRRNDVASARARLKKIQPASAALLPGLRPFIEYKLGECNYRLGNYAEAGENYRTFLGIHRDDMYMATANFRLGVSLELTGRREQAISYYQAATRAEKKFGDDAYSARKAEAYLKREISVPDSVLLRGQGLLRSGRYNEAEAAFMLLRQTPGIPPVVTGEAEFGFGEALYEQGKYREALEQFHRVTGLKHEKENTWLVPWSQYQAGLCHMKLGEHGPAKASFEKSLEYEDYDFANWLSFRAKRQLDEIARKR